MADHIGYLFLVQLLPSFCPAFARHCPARESYERFFLRVKTAAQSERNNRSSLLNPHRVYAKLNKGVSNVIKDKLYFNVFLMLSISIRMYIPQNGGLFPKKRPWPSDGKSGHLCRLHPAGPAITPTI